MFFWMVFKNFWLRDDGDLYVANGAKNLKEIGWFNIKSFGLFVGISSNLLLIEIDFVYFCNCLLS